MWGILNDWPWWVGILELLLLLLGGYAGIRGWLLESRNSERIATLEAVQAMAPPPVDVSEISKRIDGFFDVALDLDRRFSDLDKRLAVYEATYDTSTDDEKDKPQ